MSDKPKSEGITVQIGTAVETDTASPANIVKSVEVGMAVEFSATFSADVVKAVNLLLQTIIVPGAKTTEGTLVEAVSLPWFKIIEAISRDPKIAFEIGPRKWEEIIAGAYIEAGFDDVVLTPHSGDLGRDVIAVKQGIGTIRIIDQVKAYGPGHLVEADHVRSLLGVLEADKASKGFLTTTSDFAPNLSNDILLKPYIPSRLALVNGKQLFTRLKELAQSRKD